MLLCGLGREVLREAVKSKSCSALQREERATCNVAVFCGIYVELMADVIPEWSFDSLFLQPLQLAAHRNSRLLVDAVVLLLRG